MAEEKKELIKIRGANEHNLKNLDVDIPRNKLVVLTGLSGSGKSSLLELSQKHFGYLSLAQKKPEI